MQIRITRPAAGSRGSTVPRPLPDWFKANRVKGHTRLSYGAWGETDEFKRAAEGFKALGARAFTRHVKTGDEDPWPDPVWQKMIDEAHTAGLHIVGYYWHQSEQAQAADETLICKKPNGKWIEGDRGLNLDITGPFGDVVLERLQKLAGLGIDGLMFDERHLPPTGCWGSALEDAWRAEKLRPPPPAIDDADETYREYIDFKARRIEDTFARWRDAVKAEHPGVVFIVSTTTIPGLTDREMTTRLAREADSSKNEYRLALNDNLNKHVFEANPELAPVDHVRQAIGWTVLRDAADARPPHIWVSGVPNIQHACAAAGSLLTFGCIANMDVDEQSLLGNDPHDGKTPLDALEAAFDLGRRASPYLADALPLRWAAVHFAEAARNHQGDNYRAAWEQVLWPFVGAFQALSEDGLPVGVVDDDQLARGALDGYRVLVLPSERLTGPQQTAVAAFRRRGGVVIESDPDWGWADPAMRDAAFHAFRAALGKRGVATAPLRVTGLRDGSYAIAYLSGRRLVVAVTNEFGWVQITNRRNIPDVVNDPAPPLAGVQVTWRKGCGLPETWDWLPWPRLSAFDAVSRKPLTVERVVGGYRIRLPETRFMALVVVERLLRPRIPRE